MGTYKTARNVRDGREMAASTRLAMRQHVMVYTVGRFSSRGMKVAASTSDGKGRTMK